MLATQQKLSLELNKAIFTHARQSRAGGGSVLTTVCLCVFPDDISKTDAARIIELNTSVPPWVVETHLFLCQRSKVKVTKHKNSAGMGFSASYI